MAHWRSLLLGTVSRCSVCLPSVRSTGADHDELDAAPGNGDISAAETHAQHLSEAPLARHGVGSSSGGGIYACFFFSPRGRIFTTIRIKEGNSADNMMGTPAAVDS